jgi:hypothetical protein
VEAWKRCGQPSEWPLKTEPFPLSLDIPDMPDTADMQWCFPFRRQHSPVFAATEAKAIGAKTPQPISDNTKLASNRRILNGYASTSESLVTMELLAGIPGNTFHTSEISFNLGAEFRVAAISEYGPLTSPRIVSEPP